MHVLALNPLAPERCPKILWNILWVPILASVFDYFPVELVLNECQYSQVIIGTGYDLVHDLNQCWPRLLLPYGVTRANGLIESNSNHIRGLSKKKDIPFALTHCGQGYVMKIYKNKFSHENLLAISNSFPTYLQCKRCWGILFNFGSGYGLERAITWANKDQGLFWHRSNELAHQYDLLVPSCISFHFQDHFYC